MISFCRLCGGESHAFTSAVLMEKHSVEYYDCPTCGYVQTETPYWLAEAYSSPINTTDIGILDRNFQNVRLIFLLNLLLFGFAFRKVMHVDYAGGYGILVRMLRTLKFNSYWHDKYCKNLFAYGHEWRDTEHLQAVDLLSAFEVFEHFDYPDLEISKLLSISKNLLFTTRLIADEPPKTDEWWYYGLEHGQHIGFFREKTLNYIAKKYKINILTDGKAIHLLTTKKPSKFAFLATCLSSKISFFSLMKKM